MYIESFIIHQISNEKPFPKTWSLLFSYTNGSDGTYASYSKRINLDTSNQFKIIINEDTNIIEGTLSNIILPRPDYEGNRLTKAIIISEGSFRTSVIK